ncbi:MAG TPA: class I SAM-dependent methyltransferase [Aquella sp.]|nr:class I SAM-dependent methyltransferase [Aquella sp.]
MQNENISSAEMTAFWRSEYPKLSHDSLSKFLSSPEGIRKSHEFETKYNYPLIGRKVSVRAGWFLEEAVYLLKTGYYNSCISLGSGLSMLTYYLSKYAMANKNLSFLDVDMEEMIAARTKRISSLDHELLDGLALNRISTLALDLEYSYQSGRKFIEIFGTNQTPVFIIEGMIYFLSKGCVDWIFEGIQSYKNYVVLFDYWPENAPNMSECFKHSIATLNNFIPEQTRGLLSSSELNTLCKNSNLTIVSLQEKEQEFSIKNGEKPQFMDQNSFFPVQLAIVTPK